MLFLFLVCSDGGVSGVDGGVGGGYRYIVLW